MSSFRIRGENLKVAGTQNGNRKAISWPSVFTVKYILKWTFDIVKLTFLNNEMAEFKSKFFEALYRNVGPD